MNIHENIKRIRTESNITQKCFAKALGIPYQTYNNYERGYRTPNPEMLLKIAKELGVSIEKIFEENIYETKN
ncbi:hypothetical protein A0U40_17810 [[Bacillus] sp. KCTC 13219]|nr:hypothetical protein A0U40_17810 [[Bacillus] sp. KCTC 13219]